MAAPKIQLRRSSVSGRVPTTLQLQLGELAINTYDGRLYIKQDTGGVGVDTSVILVNPWMPDGSGITYTGDVNIGAALTVAGQISANGNIALPDDGELIFGDSADFKIYHDGDHTYLDETGQGNLKIRTNTLRVSSVDDTKVSILGQVNSDVELYYDGSEKLRTTNDGVFVTGILTATSFSGDGSGLTGLPAGGLWTDDGVGISTTAKVGVGTETANSNYDLHVVGSGTTALFVEGGARVTGLLSVGQNTIMLDGENNVIMVGDEMLLAGDHIEIGGDINIGVNATGINTCPNVLYVAKDGIDTNNGTSIDGAKLTIAGALAIAESGTTIFVKSGTYSESNPLTVPAGVSIVGDSLREVTVTPQTPTSDLFYVNKGTLLQGMTFTGHTAPAAAVAFPPGGATNVGGGKWESPYVRNCTSNTTTGTGMRIDGDLAESLKSMVVDSYTQYNQGGVGIAITNQGYAQLVSAFTVCCDTAVSVHKGGQCSLSNSNCDFGNFGLVADGVSDLQFDGQTTELAASGTSVVTVDVGAATTRPYSGQVVYFDTLYNTVQEITITNGGSGYTSTPDVTFTAPTGPNGRTATARATVTDGVVTAITLISSGSQYEATPTITIGAPDSGVTATATAELLPTYYTINSSTPISSGITTVTLDENLLNSVGSNSTVNFYQQSKIVASSHTFEYVGSGIDITTATPKRGGVAIPANEVVMTNGGKVVYTSTDQAGNFKIGDDLTINQNTGTISGRAFTQSLFAQMTPFILALSD